MEHPWKGRARYAVAGTFLSVMLGAAPVAAHTLYVANHGDDTLTPPCGNNPVRACRSISKAIASAVDGDTILVGPGFYGDLNGNGVIGDVSGEEAAEVGTGCECMIKVDKFLHIKSHDGALNTILDGGNLVQTVVSLQATRVDFGGSSGFTIRNGTAQGVRVDPAALRLDLRSNIASSNPIGFLVIGSPNGHIYNNLAKGNGIGFQVSGTGTKLDKNRAEGNTNAGFIISGQNHIASKNIATSNNYGFRIKIDTGATAPLGDFTYNGAVANTTAGVYVEATDALGAVLAGDYNDLYGNGRNANNCGVAVDNQDADLSHTLTPDFSTNYWGATTGPGPEPADNFGGVCNTGPGATEVLANTPRAQEITIPVLTIR